MHMYIHIHIYMLVCMYVFIYIYIYTHHASVMIYTYMCNNKHSIRQISNMTMIYSRRPPSDQETAPNTNTNNIMLGVHRVSLSAFSVFI